jgi:hypothetical protein
MARRFDEEPGDEGGFPVCPVHRWNWEDGFGVRNMRDTTSAIQTSMVGQAIIRELQHLKNAGYTRVGDYLRPPH